MHAASPTPDKATRREWIGLFAIVLPCLIYSMDLTVLNLAVPTLTAELKPTASQLLWIIDIYGFVVAGFLMTMGTLGDRIGRRRLLMIGAAAFGAASIAAAMSTSAEMLIVTRALLGLGGATLAPSTLSLITVMFKDGKERTFAISMWIAAFSAGAIIGPVVGGALIEWFHWSAVFLIAVPPMALLLAIGPRLLPEYRDPRAGRLDLVSAAMSLAAVLGVIYGVKRVAEFGPGLAAFASIAAGLAVGWLFVRRQKRLFDPMIDMKLFANPAFGASILINLAGILFMFGSFIYFAQYLQLVAGLTPLQAGLWSLPTAVALTLCSFATPWLAARIPPHRLIVGGTLLAAAGFAGQSVASNMAQIIGASVVFCIGFTPVITLTTGLIVGAAPPEKTGAASAMSETGAELGGALGVAMLGSLGAALYRWRMGDVAIPGLDPDRLPAAKATLGGALASASALSPPQAEALKEAARAAFMTGFRAAAVLSILGMVFCAWLAATRLKGAKTAGH